VATAQAVVLLDSVTSPERLCHSLHLVSETSMQHLFVTQSHSIMTFRNED